MVGPDRAEIKVWHVRMPDMDVLAEVFCQGVRWVTGEDSSQGWCIRARTLIIRPDCMAHGALHFDNLPAAFNLLRVREFKRICFVFD